MNMKQFIWAALGAVIIMTGCSKGQRDEVQSTKDERTMYEGMEFVDARMERGVKQVASLCPDGRGKGCAF